MISDQVIAKIIAEVKEIADVDLAIADVDARTVIGDADMLPSSGSIKDFSEKETAEEVIEGRLFIRISEEGYMYVLISDPGEKESLCARLAAAQIRNLIGAYRDKVDRDSFFQNLLLDNLLPVDIIDRAGKLGIEPALHHALNAADKL